MKKEKQTVAIHSKYPLLIHCNQCGEYKGVIHSAEIEPGKHRRFSDANDPVIITCLRDGIRCVHCGKTSNRPISDYYDKAKDVIIHAPYYAGMACKHCGKIRVSKGEQQ